MRRSIERSGLDALALARAFGAISHETVARCLCLRRTQAWRVCAHEVRAGRLTLGAKIRGRKRRGPDASQFVLTELGLRALLDHWAREFGEVLP